MTCPSCGTELAGGVSACQACGAPVGAFPASATPDAAPVGPRPSGPSTSLSQRQRSNREERAITVVRVSDVLLGRYRLEQKIGEGGMGTVYVAHDLELDRQVAVKLLAANLVTDDEVVERFEREARLTAKLDHPHIAPVYDVGRHEGRPFIVMKLLQGDTLAGVLRNKGGFSSDDTLKLMRQLAAGIDYIHAQGFIHRDIKAGNIFIGPNGHATILDFGILRPKSASLGLTRAGMVMGTPHYMAPEQALGLRDVDHRVDIYALAVVLFECLTGTLPFEAESELRLIQLQAHAPPPDLLERAPWIAKPVADVVRRALAKRPDERFDSGVELVKALEVAYRESKGHPAAPPRAPPAVPTHTVPSQRAAAALPEAPPPPAAPAAVQTPEPPAPPRRRGSAAVAAVVAVALAAAGALWWRLSHPVEPLASTPVDAGALVAVGVADAAVEAIDVADAAVATAGLDGGEATALAGPTDAGDAGEALAVAATDAGADPKHTLEKKKGQVSVVTTHGGEPYWAQVSIDGVVRGRTPLALELPVGKYHLLVERPGFRSEEREIRVASGKAVVLRIALVP